MKRFSSFPSWVSINVNSPWIVSVHCLNVSFVSCCIFAGCKTEFYILIQNSTVVSILARYRWARLCFCPWNWWSADETHRRRNWATATVGIAPLRFSSSPPFAARMHFPLSIYADIAGNLRGEVEASSRLEEALHTSSVRRRNLREPVSLTHSISALTILFLRDNGQLSSTELLDWYLFPILKFGACGLITLLV